MNIKEILAWIALLLNLVVVVLCTIQSMKYYYEFEYSLSLFFGFIAVITLVMGYISAIIAERASSTF